MSHHHRFYINSLKIKKGFQTYRKLKNQIFEIRNNKVVTISSNCHWKLVILKTSHQVTLIFHANFFIRIIFLCRIMPNPLDVPPSSPTTQDLLQLYVEVVQLVEQWRAQQLAEIDRDYRHMLALESALLEWTIDD